MGDAHRDALKARYEDPARAASYVERSSARHAAELDVLGRALDRLPGEARWLDAPAGNGRIARVLADRGHRVTACDISRAMLTAAPDAPPDPAVGDALALPFRAGAFDAALCFRFIYHLDGADARARLLAELARVTRANVVLSIRHPVSWHAIERRVRGFVRGRFHDPHATSVRRIAAEARHHGLSLVAADAQARYRREFWIVTFEKSR